MPCGRVLEKFGELVTRHAGMVDRSPPCSTSSPPRRWPRPGGPTRTTPPARTPTTCASYAASSWSPSPGQTRRCQVPNNAARTIAANYAGTAPITRASGKSRVMLARVARNRRLADALYQWAFSALSSSPGARAYYDAHRARGATHHAALRALANRLVGILHGCLRRHQPYDEDRGWAQADPVGQAA
jgi:hypothetical protein